MAQSAPDATGSFPQVEAFRLGGFYHDAGVFGDSKEESGGATLELRFREFDSDLMRAIGAPRLHVGLNAAETTALYSGLTWLANLGRGFYVSGDLGLAVHSGKLQTSQSDRKELGSRVLFRLAAEVGYDVSPRVSLGVRLDHMSHATLLADENEGLDTLGLVATYRF
ncbi:MAG: acyloxyacyl hydrolase [Thermohalobaculum sp.]|nr:acyloxyacyl hydrolase [Thermohalobaculum sp.]